jgi:hypothetical protein
MPGKATCSGDAQPDDRRPQEKAGTIASVLDPVMHVGNTTLTLEDPGPLQRDLLGSEALEQMAPLPEEHRDDMKLELVEDAGGECELRGCGAVDKHVLVARSVLGWVIALVTSFT